MNHHDEKYINDNRNNIFKINLSKKSPKLQPASSSPIWSLSEKKRNKKKLYYEKKKYIININPETTPWNHEVLPTELSSLPIP